MRRKRVRTPAKVREALMGGFASSKILEVHGERMIKRTFDPGFRIELHQKDLNLALQGAKTIGVALPQHRNGPGIVQFLQRSRWRRVGSLGHGACTGNDGRPRSRQRLTRKGKRLFESARLHRQQFGCSSARSRGACTRCNTIGHGFHSLFPLCSGVTIHSHAALIFRGPGRRIGRPAEVIELNHKAR